RGDCASLIFVTEIEWIPKVVSNGITAAAFGGRWQPEAGVTGFGDFRDFIGDLLPAQIEELKHGFGLGSKGGKDQSGQEKKHGTTLWKHGPRVAEWRGKRKLTVGRSLGLQSDNSAVS